MPLPLPLSLLLATLGFVLLSPASAGGQEAKSKSFQEYFHPLKGQLEGSPKLLLIGAEAKDLVKLEPDGLRITLPAGFDGERKNHGVNSGMIVQGDFEITVSFEVLKEPGPGEAGAKGTKVHLSATVNRPPWDVAGFSRHVRPNFPTKFTAWCNRMDEETGKNQQEIKGIDAKATKWRFRLSRTGAVLSYLLAGEDDPDFKLLERFAWFEDDLKDIRIVASTGGPQAVLDVRVTDLRIRAESLPNLSKADAHSDGAIPAGGEWKSWLAAGAAVVLILGLTLAVRQSRRRGKKDADRAAPTEATANFACPGCGKNLKVKVETAGKKVKCPHCGQVVPCAK